MRCNEKGQKNITNISIIILKICIRVARDEKGVRLRKVTFRFTSMVNQGENYKHCNNGGNNACLHNHHFPRTTFCILIPMKYRVMNTNK